MSGTADNRCVYGSAAMLPHSNPAKGRAPHIPLGLGSGLLSCLTGEGIWV